MVRIVAAFIASSSDATLAQRTASFADANHCRDWITAIPAHSETLQFGSSCTEASDGTQAPRLRLPSSAKLLCHYSCRASASRLSQVSGRRFQKNSAAKLTTR